MTISQTLLPEFDEEMKNTRKLLDRVPNSALNYQPHPKSMRLDRLATHVAEIPSWINITLDREVLELDPGYKPQIAASKTELLQLFDKNVAEARSKIAAAKDSDWSVNWTFKIAGDTVMSMPRAVVMRSMIMNHLVHHRAQLGVFLRLNDVEIPGMYGPSADDTAALAAQNA